jgi:hypothetical protein
MLQDVKRPMGARKTMVDVKRPKLPDTMRLA